MKDRRPLPNRSRDDGSGVGVADVSVHVPDAEALGIMGVPVGSEKISIDAPPRWASPNPFVITPNAKDAPWPSAGFPVAANHS